MRVPTLVIAALMVPVAAAAETPPPAVPPPTDAPPPAAAKPADAVPPAPGEKPKNQKGEPVDTLTPVRPVPAPRRLPAYQLYLEVDAPIFTIAAVFAIGRQIRGGLAPAYCAPVAGSPMEMSTRCDPAVLNVLDRQVAGRYQPSWEKWSNIGLTSIELLAGAGIIADEGLTAGINDLVVVAEATLFAGTASGISTAITGRPRPYMYGVNAPLSVRENGDGALSFFSAHTAFSFGATTATFVTFRRLHPDARWPWLVLAGGSAAAAFVGSTRILAGDHFPTDVAAGAAVGAAIGLLVPALHEAPRRMEAAPMAVVGGGGISVRGLLP
jgi:membrane-associated phospholipid phosphatase